MAQASNRANVLGRGTSSSPPGLPSGLRAGLLVARLAQGSERRPELLGEQLGLLPGGEVAAPVDLVEVGEGGVGPLDPTPRAAPDLTGERGEADRDRDLRRSPACCSGLSGDSVAVPVRP